MIETEAYRKKFGFEESKFEVPIQGVRLIEGYVSEENEKEIHSFLYDDD